MAKRKRKCRVEAITTINIGSGPISQRNGPNMRAGSRSRESQRIPKEEAESQTATGTSNTSLNSPTSVVTSPSLESAVEAREIIACE